MRLAVFCALIFVALGAFGADKKEKPPEIELVQGSARRQTGSILVDGKVRNCGIKPIKNLVLLFHFHDSDKHVVTTRKGGIDPDVLEPGDEAEFHAEMEEPPRATHYSIEFEDGDGKFLRPAKPVAVLAIE